MGFSRNPDARSDGGIRKISCESFSIVRFSPAWKNSLAPPVSLDEQDWCRGPVLFVAVPARPPERVSEFSGNFQKRKIIEEMVKKLILSQERKPIRCVSVFL
jgi:hypothetical protein